MTWWRGVFLLYLFAAAPVLASVYINEFSSNSDTEWIELYNNSGTAVDITGWSLKDKANPAKLLTGSIPAMGYFVFEYSGGWLNNPGDTITLFDNSTPSAQIINHIAFGDEPDPVVGEPEANKSSGRTPDGSSAWLRNLSWTKNSANPDAPTSLPLPSPPLLPNRVPLLPELRPSRRLPPPALNLVVCSKSQAHLT